MAIYVQVTGGSHQSQSRWSGSNVDLKFDGSTAVTLSASAVGPTCDNGAQPQADGTCADGSDPGNGAVSPAWTALAAGNVRWTLLDAPEGTAFDQAWFSSNNGGPATDTPVSGVNPLLSGGAFIPDKEGSWFFLVENTATSESIYFVVSVMSDTTGIRIPAAGETSQADQDKWNRVYASMKDQGWAKDRNYALNVLNDLATAGGLQVCYFDDALIANPPFLGYLKAGAALAINEADPTYTHPVTGVQYPKVILADGNTKYKYIGIVKHGWYRPNQDDPITVGAQPNPNRTWPKVKTTTEIPNQSLVVVSRAGFVECTSGINTTDPASGFVAGQLLYLSAQVGLTQAGSDRFALGVSKTTYVVPVAILLKPSATESKIITLPHDYLGGISAATKDQSFRFVGVGDFRGLRIGSTDAAAVAGESAGVIEVVGTNSSGGTLTAGTVVSIIANPAGAPLVYKADSGSANSTQWSGTIGVAIENVANTATGHFAVFGAISATAYGAPTDRPVYVGSSRHSSGDQSGKIVELKEVSGSDIVDQEPDKIIPVGSVNAAGQLMLGWHQKDGLINVIKGGIATTDTDAHRAMINNNKSNIVIKDATVDKTDENPTVNIKVAGSGADDSLADVTMFESKISGSQMHGLDPFGASVVSGVSSGTMGGARLLAPIARVPSKLYGTFCLDGRLSWYNQSDTTSDFFSGVDSPLTVKVYATVPADYNASKVLLQASVRFNCVSMLSGTTHYPSTLEPNSSLFWPIYKNVIPAQLLDDYSDSTTASDYKTVCWSIPLVDYETMPSTMLTDGTFPANASGTKYAGSALDKFGAPAVDSASQFYMNIDGRESRYNDGHNRSATTADILLYRTDTDVSTDASAADQIIVTQVTLESAKHKMVRGKRGRYESSSPGSALLTNNATLVDASKHVLTGSLSTINTPKWNNVLSEMVGTSMSAGSGGGANNVCYTFFTRDKRATPKQVNTGSVQYPSSLLLKVFGKFSCPDVGTGNKVGLQAYVKEVKKNDVLNVDISLTTPAVTSNAYWVAINSTPTVAPVSIANSYHAWEVPAPSDDDVVGWWVKLTRIAPTDVNGQEVFFIVTNIQLESNFDSSVRSNYRNVQSPIPGYYGSYKDSSGILDVPDDVYEHHVHPTEMFRRSVTTPEAATNKFTRTTDITGYGPLQNTGGSPFVAALWSSALDYRYDDKSGLLVDVISAVTTSGGTVNYDLYVRYEDCFHSAADSSANRYHVGTVTVDNSAAIAASSARYLKHQFVVPPDALWDTVDGVTFYDNPDYTDGRNKGTVYFELIRSDTQAYTSIIVGAVVQSPHGNKTKLGEIFALNINERTNLPSAIGSDSGSPNPVYVPGYTHSGPYRSVDMSIQRFTWGFRSTKNRSDLVPVAPGATTYLVPNNVDTGNDVYPFNDNPLQEGYYIPYSFVITDVYGTCSVVGTTRGTYNPVRGDKLDGGTVGSLFNNSPGVTNIPGATGYVLLHLTEIPSSTYDSSDGWSPSGGTIRTQQAILGDACYLPTGPAGAAANHTALLAQGVHNFPLVLYPNNAGVIRWNGSSMSNDGTWLPNPRKLPIVHLPADYMALGPYHPAGFPWQLSASYVNSNDTTSPHAAQSVKINITVQVALVHNPEDQHYALMGGAVSKGRSWWSVPSTYNAKLPKVSDLGIDTTILRQWVSSALNDPAHNDQRIGVFFIPGPPLTPRAYPPYSNIVTTLGKSLKQLTINSYLQQSALTQIRIIMDAADAAVGMDITVFGADLTGAKVQNTVTVTGVTTDIDTPAGNKWSRVDAVFTSVAPAQAAGFTICAEATPADVFGKISLGQQWWGVWSINKANGGIVTQARSGLPVAKVRAIEANTGSPKNQFRRIPIWGNVGATLTHTADRLSMTSPSSATDLWKSVANSFTAATDLNSIEYIGVTDWPLHDPSLQGSPTLFSLYDPTTSLRPPWPVDLAAMFAIFDSADAGLVVNVTGIDTTGATVTLPVTATLWDPTSSAPTWNVSASVFEEIHGIAWATRAPYGEWLVGNFAVPWRDESTSLIDTNTGVYIAYGSILY